MNLELNGLSLGWSEIEWDRMEWGYGIVILLENRGRWDKVRKENQSHLRESGWVSNGFGFGHRVGRVI